MSDNTVTAVVVGAGYLSKDNGMGPIAVHSYEETFNTAEEFGKFIGEITRRVERETRVVIPPEAMTTWSVDRIEGGSVELFSEWSNSFAESSINRNGLTQREVLLYWLQYSGDKRITKALLELE